MIPPDERLGADAAGVRNIDDLLDRKAGSAGGGPGAAASATMRFEISAVQLDDVQLHLRDEVANLAGDITDVKTFLVALETAVNTLHARGMYFFDYGNAFLLESSRAGADNSYIEVFHLLGKTSASTR